MTNIPSGKPIWFDLGSPDVAASAEFYTRLFGWTATVITEPGAGGYTTFALGDRLAAAVAEHQIDTPYHRPYGPDQQVGMPAIWTVYFATDDADTTTKRVMDAGGEIIMEPMDVFGMGRMAVFADPAGAAFAVWQPMSMRGADITGEPSSVTFVELVTNDAAGVQDFYARALGLTAKNAAVAGSTGPLWSLDGTVVGGTRDLADSKAVRPHWSVAIGVADCDRTIERAIELGGSVERPASDTPLGRRAELVDPHGAGFTILTKDPAFLLGA